MLEREQSSRGTSAALVTNVLLATLILTLAGVACYVRFFFRPRVDPDYARAVAQAVRERLETHAPAVEVELASLGQEAWPIVQTALIQRARHDYPVYGRALEQEGTEYFNNVERAFVTKVKARYREYLQRHRDILKSEFPEHATRENVEQILAAFESTFDEVVERYYIDQFRHEATRTQKLWAAIPRARQPTPEEPALEKQLGDTAQQWMISLLQAPPPSSPLSSPAAREPKPKTTPQPEPPRSNNS